MVNADVSTIDRNRLRASFAAELTRSVYPAVLRLGLCGRWIDIEMDLWNVLSERISNIARHSCGPQSLTEAVAWRAALVSELTQIVYRTALCHGLRDPFHKVEPALRRPIREMLDGIRPGPALGFDCAKWRSG